MIAPEFDRPQRVAFGFGEAKQSGNAWQLLSAALFGGQAARFMRVAEAYRELVKRHGRW